MGRAIRRDSLQRACHGRVRRGFCRFRTHPRSHQYYAAPHRDPLQRVPVRTGICGCIIAGATGAGDIACKEHSGVEIAATDRAAGAFRSETDSNIELSYELWSESGMSIQAINISKRFGQFVALDNVDLEIPSGELVALLGPSGSGKTTLLRVIAGLEFADSGSVQFDGRDISDRTARERRVGFVFQHYALFRHMTVFENIAFGLRVRPRDSRPSKKQIEAKVHELLKLIQLETLAQRYPSQLSGGQRQRVALARALAVEPSVLLLDEPFGALDAKVRLELRRWLRQLHDEIHVTSVFVTHDQEEALEVADRVVVMNHGRIEQIGSPEEVYNQPATPFVYNFLGNVNLFHGRIDGGT